MWKRSRMNERQKKLGVMQGDAWAWACACKTLSARQALPTARQSRAEGDGEAVDTALKAEVLEGTRK